MENTPYAHLVAITVFIAAVAIGCVISLEFADRVRRPLRLITILTALLAFGAIVSPFVIDAASGVFAVVYRSFEPGSIKASLIKFVLAGLLVLLPASMLGSMLPVFFSRMVRSGEGIGFSGAILYGSGGLGAAAGTLLAGFVMIPIAGYHATLYITVAFNVLLSIILLRLSAKEGELAEVVGNLQVGIEKSSQSRYLISVLLIVSVFSALIYQIATARALILVFDTTVYSVNMILATFILSVSIGSIITSLLLDKSRDIYFLFAVTQLALVVAMLIVSTLIANLPLFIFELGLSVSGSTFTYRVLQFVIIFALQFLTGAVLGSIFPVVLKLYLKDLRSSGRDAGIVYVLHVATVMFAIIVGVFFFFSLFGIRGTILLCAFLAMLCSASVFLLSSFTPRVKFTSLIVAVVLLPPGFVFATPWDMDLLTSGAAVYPSLYNSDLTEGEDILSVIKRKNSVVYYSDGNLSAVSVARSDDGTLSLVVDGSIEAKSDHGSLVVQELLADLALIFNDDPKDVLLIGLGGGTALQAVTEHDVERIDCVEVSEGVAEAATYFRKVNGESMLDWRLNIFKTDGRVHLESSGERYDVIISTPFEPWLYGNYAYFTREYFEAARKSLNEGGIMVQRLNAGRLSEYGFKVALRTFAEVFPHALLWEVSPEEGDFIIMGAAKELRLDYKKMEERFELEKKLHDLNKAGVTELSTLLATFVMDEEGLRAYTDGAELNTDDNALLEYLAASDMIGSLDSPIESHAAEFFVSPLEVLENIDNDAALKIAAADEALSYLRKAKYLIDSGAVEEAADVIELVIAADSQNSDILRRAAKSLVELADLMHARGDIGKISERHYSRAIEVYPEGGEAWYKLGRLYRKRGRLDDAVKALVRAEELKPYSPGVHANLAVAYRVMGFAEDASKESKLASRLSREILDE